MLPTTSCGTLRCLPALSPRLPSFSFPLVPSPRFALPASLSSYSRSDDNPSDSGADMPPPPPAAALSARDNKLGERNGRSGGGARPDARGGSGGGAGVGTAVTVGGGLGDDDVEEGGEALERGARAGMGAASGRHRGEMAGARERSGARRSRKADIGLGRRGGAECGWNRGVWTLGFHLRGLSSAPVRLRITYAWPDQPKPRKNNLRGREGEIASE